jgi:hypothetical protein
LLIVCWRALLIFVRDRWLVATTVAQPLVLGGLVCMTQYRASANKSILFFLVILAIWLGMNNSIRELVRGRRLYLRDRLAGLDPRVFLASKAAVLTVIGAVQMLLLLIILKLAEHVVFTEETSSDLQRTSVVWLWIVLLVSYLGAVAMGLAASALVKTEAAAVAALPLLLMPQLLLSAVATGEVDKTDRHQVAFRPLLAPNPDAKLDSRGVIVATVDACSMFCISRPATLIALPQPDRTPIWLADFLHLVLLVVLAWTLAYVVFQRSEARWLRLLDLE